MQAPKIKVGDKVYIAGKPKTKTWREWVKYQRDYGDVDAAASDEAVDALFELLARLLPDEVTAQRLEDDTDLDEFIRFSSHAGVWIETIVMGKAQEIPVKNAGKTEKEQTLTSPS